MLNLQNSNNSEKTERYFVKRKKRKYNSAPWLKKYHWKPGQTGNAGGKGRGESMKTWVKKHLLSLPEEERFKFINVIDPDLAWRMAEGNPSSELTGQDGQPIIIQIAKDIADKNNVSDTSTKPNSKKSE